MLKTTTARVDINSWPGTVNLGSKLLVNGHIQYTNTGFAANSITGRDADGGLTNVSIGSGLSLSSGTLSTTEICGQVNAGATIQTVTMDALTDLTGNFGQNSGGVTGNTTSITVPTSGRYLVTYSGTANQNTTARLFGFSVAVNNVGFGNDGILLINAPAANTSYGTPFSKTIIMNLAANDTIKVRVLIDNGGAGGALARAINYYNLVLTKI
jgi:hypothetical protein